MEFSTLCQIEAFFCKNLKLIKVYIRKRLVKKVSKLFVMVHVWAVSRLLGESQKMATTKSHMKATGLKNIFFFINFEIIFKFIFYPVSKAREFQT